MTTVRNDPDSFTQGVEITINTTTRRWTLNNAGNLSGAQASLQALYSWGKEEWIADATLPEFPWALEMVTPEQGVWVYDWEPYNDASRKKIATGGWEEKTTAGVVKRRYCGVVSTPPSGVEATDQPYYEHVANTPTDFTWPGPVNEAIQTYGNVDNGNFDRRTTDIVVYCREEQKTYASASVFTNYSIATLGTGVYRVGLSVGTDIKAAVADTGIDANTDGTADVSPFSGMVFTSNTTPVAIAMAGGTYDFTYTLDCNGGTIQQGYEYWCWIIRKNSDIDAHATNTLNGMTAPAAMYYVGDRLYTTAIASGDGFALTDFNAAGINYVSFTDDTGAARTFSYTAAIIIEPSAAARADATARYYIYPLADYGTSSCALIQDASSSDLTGLVDGDATISRTYDHTAGGDVEAICVILGTAGCTNATATTTIVASESNKFVPANAVEQNYSNPV
jgi:hypothetical protein